MDREPLTPASILCGIGGGIAVYKAVEAVRSLDKEGHAVQVVMTEAAQRFVTPLTFQALLRKPVRTAMFAQPWESRREDLYPHLFPASEADVFVLLPATANLLARVANGLADDLVAASALGLSSSCLRFYCPAMHDHMWAQEAVQSNARLLDSRGWRRIGPGSGSLACGAEGPGRMAEPGVIVESILAALDGNLSLAGRRVLILSGPTREHLDSVRFLSNPSSGRMGLALAEEALARGAQVDFVSGPVETGALPSGARLKRHRVLSCTDMLEAARPLFPRADIIFFAAAPADYEPVEKSGVKRPRDAAGMALRLRPTPDIAATLCATKRCGQIAVGFALQDEEAETRAAAKLAAKGFDAIVLNHPAAMGATEAEYYWMSREDRGFTAWNRLTKRACARRLLDEAQSRLA